MLACQLSRSTFLETYVPLTLSPKYPSNIYVDLSHDTLYFDAQLCSSMNDLGEEFLSSPFRKEIRHLAIHLELWEVMRILKPDDLAEISCLDGLKSLTLATLWQEGSQSVELSDPYASTPMDHYVARLRESIRNKGNNLWRENGLEVRCCQLKVEKSQNAPK